jgi:UDP-GlcNAc:undecaprenyl-phosphate/decaprenyl-phosphate GlcNAc-1-phosphate transferase
VGQDEGVVAGVGAYALVAAVGALVTWALVPLSGRLAVRVGAVALPDGRRVHQWSTPTLGGAAMLCGLLAAVGAARLMGSFEEVFASSRAILGVVAAAVVIYAVGFIDDVVEVSAPAKTAGMVLAGSLLTLAGVSIIYFRVPFSGVILLSADLSALVTVLWVIGMANAVNLVDGLDGLAAGIVGIAAAAFFVYTVQLADRDLLRPENPSPLLAAAVVGICVGFLPHNFHPARTFMGDGGALLLGLLMAATTSSVGGQSRAQFSGQTYFFFAPLVIPLFILGVPIVDTAFAVVRRVGRRSGVTTADKGHLHHRLMNLGHGQRRSVLILWGWTAVLSGVALYPTITGKGDGLVLFGLAALALLLYTYFHPGVRAARRTAPAERVR